MGADFGWSLPPGVTDSMCDGPDPSCYNCGHQWSDHYEEDNTDIVFPCRRDSDYQSDGIEYTAEGDIAHACDVLENGEQCDCTSFEG